MQTVRLSARLEQLEHVTAFADKVLADTPASKEDRMAVELAMEEAFVNIVTYARLPVDGEVMISCEYDPAGRELRIEFEDQGYPFNPLERAEPDLEAGLTERRVGGLGIYMLKKLMSGTEYEYEEGCNRLKLWRKLSGRKGE